MSAFTHDDRAGSIIRGNDDEDSSSPTSEQQHQTHASVPHLRSLHVVFVHVDLGIGGAEQLILQLAQASKVAGHSLDIVTTRCDPNHCFASVHPETGHLYPHLHVWGRWLPATVFGRFKALCSNIRLAYLAWCAARSPADVLVLDVLPLPLFLWRFISSSSLLFYCHFPDRLLLQGNKKSSEESTALKKLYRCIIDVTEESCMHYADVIAVNSKFTQQTVRSTFPSLSHDLHVLYPALDTSSLDQTKSATTSDVAGILEGTCGDVERPMVVSLNRYERKKNLELVLQAAAWYRDHCTTTSEAPMPQIVIAGGYDTQNTENIEYLQELEALARREELSVRFLKSISDSQRAWLLQRATAVLYTPSNEHFGIVPLEVMYSETIIVAARSGGPMETVVDGQCGYLCEPTAEGFGAALKRVLEMTPAERQAMGQAGKQRVLDRFSEDRLLREWEELLSETVTRGRHRQQSAFWKPRWILHGLEAVLTFVLCWSGAFVLRWFWEQVLPFVSFSSSLIPSQEL